MFQACADMRSLFCECLIKTLKELSQEKNMVGAGGSAFMKIHSRKAKSNYL